MTFKQFGLLIMLAAIWGSSFTFIKLTTHEFGAFALMTMRIVIAAVFLLLVMFIKQRTEFFSFNYWRQNGLLWPLLLAGLLGQSLPFALFAYAELSVSAGHASILNATTPFWTAIIAYFWLRKSLSRWQVLGMLLGFFGVFLLVSHSLTGSDSQQATQQQLLATLAILLATLCYAIGANYITKRLSHVAALDVATGSTVLAAITALPFAIIWWPEHAISHNAWLAMLALGLACTGFAYLIFFQLIAKVGATAAVSVTFLIPIFGVLWGYVLLQERLTLNTVLSICIILIGILLANQLIKPKKAQSAT